MNGWMPRRARSTAIAVLVCVIGVTAVAATAWGAAMPIRATDSVTDYESALYTMTQGEKASFNNTGPGIPHNVTANARISRQRLFRSKTITGDASAPVSGTQYLTTGDYTFFCSIHPTMQATLQVTGSGTPVARPKISVAILSGQLAKVTNTGKARVRVKALTKSDNVALKLKLGSKPLASKSNIDLAPGQVRRLTLKLGRRARNRLAGKDQAKLKLVGSVPFGKTATASKLLK
jgi:plastocyanin